MLKATRFSIIVPVFNAESTLDKCVESILAQTFSDWELLLIDDGSVDSSGLMCDEFSKKDTRIRSFHKQNGGPSSARNMGLNLAKGEYICFCDSDDWVEKNWLLNFFKCTDSDFIITGFSACGWNGKNTNAVVSCDTSFGTMPDDAFNLFSMMNDSGNVGYLWCRCFRRELIEKGNLCFDERFRILEDECFIFEYMLTISNYVMLSSADYHYTVPDFNSKYNELDAFHIIECVKRILNAEKRILGTYNHPIVLPLVYRFVNCLKVLIKKKKKVRLEIDWIKKVYYEIDSANRGKSISFFKINHFVGPYTDLLNYFIYEIIKF